MYALPAFCLFPAHYDYLPHPNWEHLADLFAISTRKPRALLCVLTADLFASFRGPTIVSVTRKTLNGSVAAFNSRQKKTHNVQYLLSPIVGKRSPKKRATCFPKWRLLWVSDVLCTKQNVSFPSIGQNQQSADNNQWQQSFIRGSA